MISILHLYPPQKDKPLLGMCKEGLHVLGPRFNPWHYKKQQQKQSLFLFLDKGF